MVCSYCQIDKDEMSDEHVVPHALAGVSGRNPFLLRTVCRACNNKCGRHVDAPFLRGYLVQASIRQIRDRYTPVTADSTLPLVYLGQMHRLQHGTRVCDLWLGPAGDRIYHFHEPYDQDENARVAVGLPQWGAEANFDAGFVFIVIKSDSEFWQRVLLRSCVAEFPRSRFHLLNPHEPFGAPQPGQVFLETPPELHALRDQVLGMDGQEHGARMTAYLDAPDRFMCKLAVGFGALFLAASFAPSTDAQLLRTGLWTRSAAEREKLPIRGRKFLDHGGPLTRILQFDGCHVLAAVPIDGKLAIILALSGAESHCVLVSSDPAHWVGTAVAAGAVWVIAPGLHACVGPVPWSDFLADFAARQGGGAGRHPELVTLAGQLASIPPRPPF